MDWMLEPGIWLYALAPAIVVSLGLLCQKKPLSLVIKGAFNALSGYLLLALGAQLALTVTVRLSDLVSAGLGVRLVFASNEAAVAFGFARHAPLAVCVMVLSCAINLLAAKYTRWKSIFLSGHIVLFSAAMLALITDTLTSWPFLLQAAVGGVLLALFNIVSMEMCNKYTKQVSGDATMALAHTGNPSVFLTGLLCSYMKGKEQTAEQWRVSRGWSFFREAPIAAAVTMGAVAIALYLLFGRGPLDALWHGLVSGFLFGVAVLLILTAIRLVSGDLVSTLRFFADKLVPDANLGLDAPMFMRFAPNSWILGFLISYPLSLLLAALLMGPLRLPVVVILSSVPAFFDAGITAVVGNAMAGKRGVVLGAVVHSVVTVFSLSALSLLLPPLQEAGVVFGGPDAGVFGTLSALLIRLFGGGA